MPLHNMPIIEVLEKKLDQINSELFHHTQKIPMLGILNGLSGTSLFFFHYARFKDDSQAYDNGLSLLGGCFDAINSGYDITSYCSGIAGFGWLMEHLNEQDLVEFDNDGMLEDLDELFIAKMQSDFEKQYYDFLHGAIGYGFYFWKRYTNTKSHELKKKYRDQLLLLIGYLEIQALTEDGKTKWLCDIGIKKQDNLYDFGLAHGIPSIINFLARLFEIEEFRDRVRPLIESSVAYLLANRNTPNEGSLFPDFIPSQDTEIIRHSRMAWCYGDLGIGLTLFRVGEILQDEVIRNEAISLFMHAAHRKSPADTSVKDAGICHGAFGIALIFDKMFKATHMESFRDASLYWCQQGMEFANQPDGWAGFKKWVGGKGIWENETSLLEGIAGIGLAMITILDSFDSKWDECLMIS